MKNRFAYPNALIKILAGCILLLGIYLTSLYSFLLFHNIAELSSIIVAFSVFVIAWNTRRYQDTYFLQFLGVAYLFIAMLDLIHTMAYKGMNIFIGYDANLPTQLWIAARYLQSISYLIAPIYLHRKLRLPHAFITYSLIFVLILTSTFYWDIFPACYIEGVGLTTFKIISEYIISIILGISAVVMWWNRHEFDADILRYILISTAAAILSELAFTVYIGVYDLSNAIGHLFKIVSFYYIYMAIIRNGLVNPYDFLFLNLKKHEKELEEYQRDLEKRVDERTHDLLVANENLLSENTRRKFAEEKVQAQLKNIQALREIDMSIIGSQDIQVPLDEIIDKVINQLKVDAACIMLLDQKRSQLEPAANKGFWTNLINDSTLQLEEAIAGTCLHTRNDVFIPDIKVVHPDFCRLPLLKAENIISYHCTPIHSKDRAVGILEVFHRSVLNPSDEWKTFFSTLAGQAAIAIDNAMLFTNMQTAFSNLQLAYEKTLEGWVQALAYRDKETEEHTQRVVSMTLALAERLGIPESEMVHVRRGALLHDIGKMAIPDNILLKPGSLSRGERTIVEKHPMYARDWLDPIEYLKPAMDIPYSHHEKWDGSGYPQGLKGEEIPLPAHIFALVDVWDALDSDRPYRKAWPREKILAYLQEQSGIHFDPQVVDEFIKMISEGGP